MREALHAFLFTDRGNSGEIPAKLWQSVLNNRKPTKKHIQTSHTCRRLL